MGYKIKMVSGENCSYDCFWRVLGDALVQIRQDEIHVNVEYKSWGLHTVRFFEVSTDKFCWDINLGSIKSNEENTEMILNSMSGVLKVDAKKMLYEVLNAVAICAGFH